MEKFKFTDLITLAKSGWTPDEVNKVIDRFETLADESIEESTGADDSTIEKSSEESKEESIGADDSEIDKDAKILELENKLAEAQKINRQQNNDTGEHKTVDEMVDDIFKDYFN